MTSVSKSPRISVPVASHSLGFPRPHVGGKFLYVGNEKWWGRGVTYGAFRPDAEGKEYHNVRVIERDFAQMAASGINAVRIPHTMPPRLLLDAASKHGLRVMVGLSAEQYVGYLIDKKGAPDIERVVRAQVRACAGHPAILCYALGNEIAPPLVRWLGPSTVERYLERLYAAVKIEDPDGLVTYVNYPTAEYLRLPFLDLISFNVYLESPERFEAYLARLHNIVGDRPLILTEIGLDAMRNGLDTQARVLDWQVRTAFASGCAGAFIFAWTDEWYRAGADVDDWAFGLTDRNRIPKPALAAVREAFSEVPFPAEIAWPNISVVVCSRNGFRTIRNCLEAMQKLQYPHHEVIVVDDGSTDATAAIARQYDVRLVDSRGAGLAVARNAGLNVATGEIVAYIDDDAYPDPSWLTYLAATFRKTRHAGVGGPNVPAPDDGPIAECIANAPGGPVHVLLSDQEAEHIPGCNMAFRKESLQAIGGFDPQFRVAGDDVDVCWRLQERGWTLGFHPGAMVWHRRRDSVRRYWKQQRGYGEAEALLERKWPQKYNAAGHLTWAGRVYGKGLPSLLRWGKNRIYHGIWGSAPFQSLYQPAPGILSALLLMPEWYLAILALVGLSMAAILWKPLLIAVPVLALAVFASTVQAYLSATGACLTMAPRSRFAKLKLRALITFLHLLQPLARLYGRWRRGLTPWRRRCLQGFVFPWPRSFASWSESWQAPEERLRSLEADLVLSGAVVLRGSEYDRWDLEVRDGVLGAARLLMAVEDHGAGTQLVRLRVSPRLSPGAASLVLFFGGLSVLGLLDRAWVAAAGLGALALGLAWRTLHECAAAMAVACRHKAPVTREISGSRDTQSPRPRLVAR